MTSVSNRDREYLLAHQYRTASNLASRVNLHDRFSTNPYGWHRWLFDQFNISPDATILELGCGTGALWEVNATRILPGWHLTLSDFSSGMVEGTKQRLTELDVRCNWAVIDAQSIPYDDASFDVVIANHMLYHVPDRERSIREMRRVLRDGGQLYASTNGIAHMRELDDLLELWVPERERDDTTAKFGLQNGADQLSIQFSMIRLERYWDALEVTEVEPFLRYVRSMRADIYLNDQHLHDIREMVEKTIQESGSFHITKESGVFVCAM